MVLGILGEVHGIDLGHLTCRLITWGCVNIGVMQKSLLDIISQHVAHVEFVVAFAITNLEALPKDCIHATISRAHNTISLGIGLSCFLCASYSIPIPVQHMQTFLPPQPTSQGERGHAINTLPTRCLDNLVQPKPTTDG